MHRVRLYITVNTLVDDSELGELVDYLLFLSNVGIDGIIVQDLGVIRLARQIVPDLPLHASTQMTVTNSEGVKLAAEAGMERVVLARELSLEEINTICHGTDTEIEVFIHGALCVCYSGQCLMSSLIGGRSGNRGRCAQPCRLPYKLVNEAGEDLLSGKDAGQYLLSPKDLNTLDILPQLIEAGVTSYKIEGRMKRPEYVAVVVDAYRRAIDSYLGGDYQVPEEDFANIEQIFNRDFTNAYLPVHRSDRRPAHVPSGQGGKSSGSHVLSGGRAAAGPLCAGTAGPQRPGHRLWLPGAGGGLRRSHPGGTGLYRLCHRQRVPAQLLSLIHISEPTRPY